MERLGKMTKRTRYGGEGCGWIWAGIRMCAIIILAEISSENLLPIRADFVTERVNLRLRVTRVTALECSTGEMSSLRGPEGREDKNGESAARSTMDAESEDVMEDSLDEIDEEGMTQPVPKLVRVFYYDLW